MTYDVLVDSKSFTISYTPTVVGIGPDVLVDSKAFTIPYRLATPSPTPSPTPTPTPTPGELPSWVLPVGIGLAALIILWPEKED